MARDASIASYNNIPIRFVGRSRGMGTAMGWVKVIFLARRGTNNRLRSAAYRGTYSRAVIKLRIASTCTKKWGPSKIQILIN